MDTKVSKVGIPNVDPEIKNYIKLIYLKVFQGKTTGKQGK